MGYTTEFKGYFKILPPLPPETVTQVNTFCLARHGYDEFPSIWCDWEVSDDGKTIYWNGSEKSYRMGEWITWLQNKFFPEHNLEGRIFARGESFSDIWTMVADPKTRTISKVEGWEE